MSTVPATERMSLPIALAPLPARPLVTVLVANHNYARFLPASIESVLAQTYDHWELVIVDDGSTDGSRAVLERYAAADPRVRVLYQENGGMASAWNTGYAASRGEIICSLDSDDAFRADKIEAVVAAFAAEPAAGILVHAMTVLDPDGKEIQQVPFMTRFERGWIARDVVRRGGRWRYMPTTALCFRRELGPTVFPIPAELFRQHADAMAVTLGPLLTPVTSLDAPLSYYRIHGGNFIGGSFRDQKSAQRVLDFTLQTTEGVNRRLAELGLDTRLDETHNLEFVQATFVLALFDGTSRPELIRRYGALARALLRDDLYSRAQKVLGVGVYAVAVLLPRRTRAGWLGQSLGYSPIKRHVQRLVRGLRTVTAWRPRGRQAVPA